MLNDPDNRVTGVRRVVVAAVVTSSLAGCAGIPVNSSRVDVQVLCAMGGAVSPGYKWDATRDEVSRTREFRTVPATHKKFERTWNDVQIFEFRMSPIKRPMRNDGFITCSVLCVGCAPGERVPNPEVGKCGPTVLECRIKIAVTPTGDGGFGVG